MEALIKFRLLINQLEQNEFDSFLKKLSKDDIISHIFNSSLYIHQKYPNQQNDDIININHIISTIIRTRETNTSKDKHIQNAIIANDKNIKIPLKIDALPTEMIAECASFLDLWDYLDFAGCNRLLYVACNSPSTLRNLSTISMENGCNLNRYPLLKRLWLNISNFNDYIDSHSNLKCLSVDNEENNDHSELEKFMNVKCIDFTRIQKLCCKSFGSPQQLYDFSSFCKFLAKFCNLTHLYIYDLYLTDINDKNDEIKSLLPKLESLDFRGDDENANFLRNKLIETHSKQIQSLDYIYNEETNDIAIPSSLQLKELRVAVASNYDSLTNLIQITQNLGLFEMILCDEQINHEKVKNMMNTIFTKFIELNQISFTINYNQFEKIMEYIEFGLYNSSEMARDSIKIKCQIYSNKDKEIEDHECLINEIGVCLSRIINALDTSECKQFMMICYFYENIISFEEGKQLTAKFNRNHSVIQENDDYDDKCQHIVISNKNCSINGYRLQYLNTF